MPTDVKAGYPFLVSTRNAHELAHGNNTQEIREPIDRKSVKTWIIPRLFPMEILGHPGTVTRTSPSEKLQNGQCKFFGRMKCPELFQTQEEVEVEINFDTKGGYGHMLFLQK